MFKAVAFPGLSICQFTHDPIFEAAPPLLAATYAWEEYTERALPMCVSGGARPTRLLLELVHKVSQEISLEKLFELLEAPWATERERDLYLARDKAAEKRHAAPDYVKHSVH